MVRYIKITLRVIAFVFAFGLLHYILPQHDVVKITSTEIIRMDFSSMNRLFFAQSDSGSQDLTTRDVRLINTVKKKTFLLGFYQRDAEGIMVYRNEDTGWIWPPYFKFDSSDLQAEASANISTADKEQWVVMTHYGWRNRLLTIYPNAIAIRPVDGPNVTIIPWVNITFFVFLIVAYLFIRSAWRQFRERSIDPVLEDMEEAGDVARDRATGVWGRFTGWLGTWRSKRR